MTPENSGGDPQHCCATDTAVFHGGECLVGSGQRELLDFGADGNFRRQAQELARVFVRAVSHAAHDSLVVEEPVVIDLRDRTHGDISNSHRAAPAQGALPAA